MPLQSDDVLYVVVGDHDRTISTDAASQQVAVESVHDHEKYNADTMDNGKCLKCLVLIITVYNVKIKKVSHDLEILDVSLLKLSRALSFSNAVSRQNLNIIIHQTKKLWFASLFCFRFPLFAYRSIMPMITLVVKL